MAIDLMSGLLAKLQNPQMLEQLANSPVDPNAVMAYQMGGQMPGIPGGGPHMGTAIPPGMRPPQGNVAMPAAPAGDADPWAMLAGAQGMTQQPARPQMPRAPIVGSAIRQQAPNYGTPVRPARQQGLGDLLAGLKK